MIAQALSDDRDDLNFVIVKPAIEKTRSDGADVAGIHNMRLAKRLNRGKFDALILSKTNFDTKNDPLFGPYGWDF